MIEPECSRCPLWGTSPVIRGRGTREVAYTVKGPVVESLEVSKETPEDQYDLVFVGIAPAVEEVKQNSPFVGRSGVLLRSTAEHLGLKEFYVTNTIICQEGEKEYLDLAIDCCHRRLLDEILSKKPKLVVALGNVPLKALCPDLEYTITEVAGRVIPSLVGPLLGLEHPAGVLRRPESYYDFLEGLRNGVRFLGGTYRQAEAPSFEVVTEKTVGKIIADLGEREWIAVDMETTGFNAHGWDPDRVMCMGMSANGKHTYIVPKELIERFKPIIEDKKCIFHNAQFDVSFLKTLGINPNIGFDTMLAHYSIDERPYSHGLKPLARMYLGTDNWEKDIGKYLTSKKKDSYEVIPKEVLNVYLSKDTAYTFLLWECLKDEVNKRVFDNLLMPACRMFTEVEFKGIRIDPALVMSMDDELGKDLEVMEDELYELAGETFNPNSPKQVVELLFYKMKLPMNPHFGPSTGKEAIAHLEGVEFVDKLQDYRELYKLKNTYVEGFAKFVDRNYRIHPSIKLFGSVTGRLSSEKPSVMNIKRTSKLKRIFLPDPEHYIVDLDFSQTELRWYCIISGDEKLTKILQTREGDPHHLVSSIAFGEERAVELRTDAKTVVFGRLYGRGRPSIERQVGKNVIDPLMETVDSMFPGLKGYYENIRQQVHSRGYIETFFGRKRRFLLITPENIHQIERQAANFPIQSAASDLNLLAMLHLFKNKHKWNLHPLWPVHDSIVIDMENIEAVTELKAEVEKVATEIVENRIPIFCKVKTGKNWSMED